MAKNKAELQSDADTYRRIVLAMRAAHAERRFLDAVELAIHACEKVDGMMQYERRFEDRRERESVESIDYVLRYAPLLFDRPSLDTLASILKSQRRIDKNTTADLADKLKNSFALMLDAHRLWTLLEGESEVPQDRLRRRLGGDQDLWRHIAELWDQMGVIRRVAERGSYRLSLTSRTDRIVRGKCRQCGATGKAQLTLLLEDIFCPRCKAASKFVLLNISVP